MRSTVVVGLDTAVKPRELTAFMQQCGSTGWGVGTESNWSQCLTQSLSVITARDLKCQMVGVGFLIGNARHAELVDVAVRPDWRRRGVGSAVVAALVADARGRGIRYLNLVTDPNQPWLIGWYRSRGFDQIKFAMSLREEAFDVATP